LFASTFVFVQSPKPRLNSATTNPTSRRRFRQRGRDWTSNNLSNTAASGARESLYRNSLVLDLYPSRLPARCLVRRSKGV